MTGKNKGFTLVELLAIIVILGILAVITVPAVTKTISVARSSTLKISVTGIKRTLEHQSIELMKVKTDEFIIFEYIDGVETSNQSEQRLRKKQIIFVLFSTH